MLKKLWGSWGNQAESKKGTAAPEPETLSNLAQYLIEGEREIAARHGTYFRSSTFVHNEKHKVFEYVEAIYQDSTQSWLVQKNTKHEGVSLSSGHDFVKSGDDASVSIVTPLYKATCFFEAMVAVAYFESSHTALIRNEPAADPQGTYYRDFAHREEIIFMSNGLPRALVRGYPVEGNYSPEELAVAEQVRARIKQDLDVRAKILATPTVLQPAVSPLPPLVREDGGALQPIDLGVYEACIETLGILSKARSYVKEFNGIWFDEARDWTLRGPAFKSAPESLGKALECLENGAERYKEYPELKNTLLSVSACVQGLRLMFYAQTRRVDWREDGVKKEDADDFMYQSRSSKGRISPEFQFREALEAMRLALAAALPEQEKGRIDAVILPLLEARTIEDGAKVSRATVEHIGDIHDSLNHHIQRSIAHIKSGVDKPELAVSPDINQIASQWADKEELSSTGKKKYPALPTVRISLPPKPGATVRITLPPAVSGSRVPAAPAAPGATVRITLPPAGVGEPAPKTKEPKKATVRISLPPKPPRPPG